MRKEIDMTRVVRICGFLMVLMSAKALLWPQERSSDPLRLTPGNSSPNTLRASALAGSAQVPHPQTVEGNVITLDALMAEALDNNPEILAARRRFDAATKRPSPVSTLPE